MKLTRLSILALSFLAGGSLAAAAGVTTYQAYSCSASFTNEDMKVWTVSGGPMTAPGDTYPTVGYGGGVVTTDSAGKVSGVGMWVIRYNADSRPASAVFGSMTGKLSRKLGSPATVTMNAKASGFTYDGTGASFPLSATFKFTGQPGTSPADSTETKLVGTITGTLKGDTLAGSGSYTISSGRIGYIQSSTSSFAGVNASVLQSSKGKMQLYDFTATGNGQVKSDNSYKAALKGIGTGTGNSVSFSGNVGLYTNSAGTNLVPFLAPITCEVLKGSKMYGQAIQGIASRMTARLAY
jgi:hypothetical protein